MQKIMFNDKYCLTDLVLSGQKTQTRRTIKTKDGFLDGEANWDSAGKVLTIYRNEKEFIDLKTQYCYGEDVAIAQNYEKAEVEFVPFKKGCKEWGNAKTLKGWNNKMFIRPELMPHTITITNIRFERLQDINDEDCLEEGVLKSDKYAMPYGIPEKSAPNGVFFYYNTPQEAYATLINKINGKGTWDSNPYVWVYDFELVK